MASQTFLLPGQPISPTTTHHPGSGTHIFANTICASLPGQLTPNSSSATPSLAASKSALSIERVAAHPGQGSAILPEVESVVLARVTRLTVRQAMVEILVVAERVCKEGFQGIVRREDVRATEKDRVVVAESFRVGDVVRGVVISLGDQSSYYVSTASNELGVIMAESEAGNQMYPISWKEFKDPKTGKVEARKVAKPF